MGEQANLLTSSIVDGVCDGGEAGDRRTAQKGRFILLSTLHSSLLSFSWETDSQIADHPAVTSPLCSRPGSTLISPASGRKLLLWLQCGHFFLSLSSERGDKGNTTLPERRRRAGLLAGDRGVVWRDVTTSQIWR